MQCVFIDKILSQINIKVSISIYLIPDVYVSTNELSELSMLSLSHKNYVENLYFNDLNQTNLT